MEKALITPEPFVGRFQAMGCPCEILLDTNDLALGDAIWQIAHQEALRIEQKYSRYRTGNIVDRLNQSMGQPVEVDEETASLLDYATECYELSSGLFDITTGILRKKPGSSDLGWHRVTWQRPILQLPAGFEIDFGGVCKEYAADRIAGILYAKFRVSVLVNLGGDIAAVGQRMWSVGIEDVARPGAIARKMLLRQGGVATSGTTKRAGHILNPRTGEPVQSAPESVTVAAKTCTEAGFWSTLAILHGAGAETFLKEQELESWCYRLAS